MTDMYSRPERAGNTWWHCGECEVGWYGLHGPCWVCGIVDTVERGPVTIGQAPPERPYLSPRAARIGQAPAEPVGQDHRPWWAFWRAA